MFSYLSNLYPKGMRNGIFSLLEYFSIHSRKEYTTGTILFFTFMISLAFSFQFSRYLFPDIPIFISLILLLIVSNLVTQGLTYMIMSIIATNRGKFVESILPDALQLIAANLRAGMTIDRALIASNRTEFGYFNKQFNIVGKEISTGTRVSDSLINMTKRIKSSKFHKAMELIVTGMRSGGELSKLLNEVAENLVQQKNVEEKIKTSVTTYLIFIGAAVGFAAPMLYGLSNVIVNIIVDTFSSIEIPPNSSMPFTINMSDELAAFLPDFVVLYTRISILTLAIMASFLLGIVKSGQIKYGLTYIPGLVFFSMFFYTIVAIGANALFSSIT